MKTHRKIPKNQSKPKLIYFLCNGFPTISETFILGQISNAINNGFNINIHAEYINYLDKKLLENNSSINRMLSKTYTQKQPPDKKIERLALALTLTKNKSYFFSLIRSANPFKFGINGLSLRTFFSFSSFLSNEKPDLVHAQFGPNGVKAINARLSNIINCPIVTSFHGYDAHAEPSKLHQIRKLYSKLFLHGDLFLVNGDYLNAQLVDLGCPKNKIVQLPFGVDLNLFKPSPLRTEIRTGKVKFITIGRLIKLKNQKFGIKLLSLMRENGVNASYTIVGDGPELSKLKMLAKNLEVEKHVRFLGSLPQEKILEILPQHHIFLMTSYKDDAGRMETQGIVSAEAQACGLPVITLGFGGTADTIRHGVTGYNLSSSNPESAINYLKELINPKKYDEFSINARNFISEHYDVEITYQSLIKIYKSLIISSKN